MLSEEGSGQIYEVVNVFTVEDDIIAAGTCENSSTGEG